MSSTFTGFSEEDLKRIKSNEIDSNSDPHIDTSNARKIDKIGAKIKRNNKYKLPILEKQDSDDSIDKLFDKCKLSIKTPTSPRDSRSNKGIEEETEMTEDEETIYDIDYNKTEVSRKNSTAVVEKTEDSNKPSTAVDEKTEVSRKNNNSMIEKPEVSRQNSTSSLENRKNSISPIERKDGTNVTPDIVRSVDNYTEDELAAHRVKLGELQLKQKIMEEQNKKRKEMLAKALADRTKQTEEEVIRLEKIKKELQVLDGQFSQDVAVLRKKIDHACLSYADAEKHYLKVEKEFLQAKITLQKEKEKKELLTEHLCALITHNETRKAQKLETLMLELATDKKLDTEVPKAEDDDSSIVIDGVDQKTGKMVEFTS